MDNKDRIKMYEGGSSITSIAATYGVSRQAIIAYLKKAGVHKGVSLVKSQALHVSQLSSCPIDSVPEVDFSVCSGRRKLGRNLYATSKGYVVYDWKMGGDRLFTSRDDVLKEYGL